MARIALIDNDPNLVDLVKTVLEDAGHEVEPYREPDDVVDELVRRPPQLVVLDPWLRYRGQGWEILIDLKDAPSTQIIPVIVCTAVTSDVSDHKPWLDEQHIPLLPKPFDLSELEALVDAALTGN